MLAKGGMGDVLTGMCAAFAAQGMELRDAASLGTWLLGFGAEQARQADGDRPESFSPSRLLEVLASGFAALRRGGIF